MSLSAPTFKFLGQYTIETEYLDYSWANSSSSGQVADILALHDGGFLLSGNATGKPYQENSIQTRLVRLTADGLLDTSFADRGVLRFSYPGSALDVTQGAYEDANGRLIVLGNIYIASKVQVTADTPNPGQALALSRLLPDGSWDASFGQGGQLLLGIDQIDADYFSPLDLRFQDDGKMLVLTTAGKFVGNTQTSMHTALLRLNADGSLDSSYNGSGVLHLPAAYGSTGQFGGGEDDAVTLSIRRPGGSAYLGPVQWTLTDLQVSADGSVFGEPLVSTIEARKNNGWIAIRAFDVNEAGQRLVVADTGKIWFARKVNADGSVDASFNGGQDLVLPLPPGDAEILGDQVLPLPDGGYLVAGRIYWPTATGQLLPLASSFLLKIAATGQLDIGFGKDGLFVSEAGQSLNQVKVLADGSVLWGGSAPVEWIRYQTETGKSFAVTKLKASGQMDLAFGGEVGIYPRTMVEEGSAEFRQLSAFASMVDADIIAPGGAGNYAGYRLEIERKSGATQADAFAGLGGLVFNDEGRAVLDGVDVGQVLSLSGTFSLVLNENATPTALNRVLSHIGYKYLAQSIPDDAPTVQATNPGYMSGGLSDYRLLTLRWQFQEPRTGDGLPGLVGQAHTDLLLAANNDPTTGYVAIEGKARVGSSLRVVAHLDDPDGPLRLKNFQWFADGEWIWGQGNGTDTLQLTAQEFGKRIFVQVQSEDMFGYGGNFSASTETAVTTNGAPIGDVTITGTATQGQTLTVSNTLADVDGIPTSGDGAIKYQWKAGGTVINGASASTYILTQADVGKDITVTASYVDLFGQAESVSSAATSAVLDINPVVTPVKYWKDASKTPSETNKAGAVNLTDAISILKMIVGLSVNANNAPLSPYQAVAADFDQSGSVDLGDAIGVLKMVVGLAAPTPAWKYFDDGKLSSSYSATQPLNHKAWSAGAAMDVPLTADSTVKLVGVLTGDVDGSWAG